MCKTRHCRVLVLLILASGVGLGVYKVIAAGDGEEPTRSEQSSSQAVNGDFAQGVAKWKQGDVDDAIALFSKAIQKTPSDARLLLTRGLAYYDNNDLDKAIADFTGALENHRNDSRALRARARAFTITAIWTRLCST